MSEWQTGAAVPPSEATVSALFQTAVASPDDSFDIGGVNQGRSIRLSGNADFTLIHKVFGTNGGHDRVVRYEVKAEGGKWRSKASGGWSRPYDTIPDLIEGEGLPLQLKPKTPVRGPRILPGDKLFIFDLYQDSYPVLWKETFDGWGTIWFKAPSATSNPEQGIGISAIGESVQSAVRKVVEKLKEHSIITNPQSAVWRSGPRFFEIRTASSRESFPWHLGLTIGQVLRQEYGEKRSQNEFRRITVTRRINRNHGEAKLRIVIWASSEGDCIAEHNGQLVISDDFKLAEDDVVSIGDVVPSWCYRKALQPPGRP